MKEDQNTNKNFKLGLVSVIVFGLLFGLFITYNILKQTNKDYDNKIQEMEYKLDVLESMISKSDTIIININKIKN